MALVIEDGTQKSNANSYVTVAEYDAFLDARYTARTDISDAQAEAYILRAMDYFESRQFVGKKATDTQALQWPRSYVDIDGYAIDTNEIPKQVKNSIYELAYGFEQGYGVSDPVSRETISESVGSLSVTYKNSSADRTLTPAATQAMRKLLMPNNRVHRV
jgi:hypothetical protein